LLSELEAAEEQIKRLIRVSVLKERDPQLSEFNRQRDEVRDKLEARRAEIRSILERQEQTKRMEEYRAHLDRRRERVAFCAGLVKSLEEEVQALGGAAAVAQVKKLREEIAVGIETLRKLDAEIARDESAAVHAATNNGLEEALTVQQKNPERRLQLAGLGGASCGALLMLTMTWRELRLRRIASSGDISAGLCLPIVGSIPSGRCRALKLADLDGQGQISEAVDALRTVLLHDGGKGPHLLLVTSAAGGEGKSTLAVQLAASLARAWRKKSCCSTPTCASRRSIRFSKHLWNPD
jgi:hypothetical protein